MRKLQLAAMRSLLTLLCIFLAVNITQGQNSKIVTTDINNFWSAYDHINSTPDTGKHYEYINELFLNKGTPGLKALMKVRDYTAKSYVDAIHQYPLFWRSIRANTLKAPKFATGIMGGITKLKNLYPELRPATIYFTIGALRTSGTTQKDQILIGSELALADQTSNTTEFSENLGHLKSFFESKPINSVVFLNVHELVHTLQKTTIGNSLLAQCVLEGVAEFLAVHATGQASPTPALTYGPMHDQRLRAVFTNHMFSAGNRFWLYSNRTSEFGIRDLGYYVGYAICQEYYLKSADKRMAIKTMIELDYNNDRALNRFVDQSGYFKQPVTTLHSLYEKARPKVTKVVEIKNLADDVDPGTRVITIEFSSPMNTSVRGFEFGPLGESAALRVKRFIAFSEDGKSIKLEFEMKPSQRYQLLISDRFEDMEGRSLIPYLIDFTTKALE
jgi:hypothetical protein